MHIIILASLHPRILASFQSRTATRPSAATVAPQGRKVVSCYITHPSIQYHLMNINVQSLQTSDGSLDPARSLCKDKPLGNLHKSHFAAGPPSSGCQDYKSKGANWNQKEIFKTQLSCWRKISACGKNTDWDPFNACIMWRMSYLCPNLKYK